MMTLKLTHQQKKATFFFISIRYRNKKITLKPLTNFKTTLARTFRKRKNSKSKKMTEAYQQKMMEKVSNGILQAALAEEARCEKEPFPTLS